MGDHTVTRQQIDEFNATMDGLPPEDLLSLFVKLLRNTGPVTDPKMIFVKLSPLHKSEHVLMEIGDCPRGDRRSLAIYGIGVEGKGFKKDTFLGPLECLTRISQGVQGVKQKAVDWKTGEKYRSAMRKELDKQHKQRSGWARALTEIENVVVSQFENDLANSRRNKIELNRQQFREAIIDVEQSASLLHRVLCQLDPIPKVADFDSTFIVRIFIETQNANVQLRETPEAP